MAAFYSWVKLYDLVRTSSLQRLMMQESSNRIGNQPRTQTRSPGATFMSSLVYSLRACTWTQQEVKKWGEKRKNKTSQEPKLVPARAVSTCGLSETYLAQCRMSLMASMLVSGKAALHTNSDRHFTASWKESIAAAKCSRKVFTDKRHKSMQSKNDKVLIWNHSSSTKVKAALMSHVSVRWALGWLTSCYLVIIIE